MYMIPRRDNFVADAHVYKFNDQNLAQPTNLNVVLVCLSRKIKMRLINGKPMP